jgi:hypothetical protein
LSRFLILGKNETLVVPGETQNDVIPGEIVAGMTVVVDDAIPDGMAVMIGTGTVGAEMKDLVLMMTSRSKF